MALKINDVKSMIEESEKNIINTISGNTKITSDRFDQLMEKLTEMTNRISKLESNNIILESKLFEMEQNYS